jgi:murein DD-endopeptidase MepM/ murein hydrolase activator NlpD
MVLRGGFMAKKFLSVIIVPHTKTSTRTLSFSRRTLRILAGGGAILALVLAVFLTDYVSMNVIRHRYKALTREAAEQKAKIADYERSINELKTTVANFENYTKKLNIMVGLKSPDVLKAPAGLGGGASEPETSEPGASVPAGAPQSESPAQGSIQGLIQKAQSIESNLNSLVSISESTSLRLATTPSIMPVAGWVSSGFGVRADPFTGREQMHWGLDISTNTGNPIVATADGIVLQVLTDKYLGKHIILSHGNGITTLYGHMSGFAIVAGQTVKRGDVIGYVGMTGKAVGPHVHYEVHKDGKPVNPYNFILEE